MLDTKALEWLPGHAHPVIAKMDCALLACDREADHLHMLVEYPPKLSVSVVVNAFKGTSSRMLRPDRPDIAARYREAVLWSPSYFAASTGGVTLEKVKRYVEQQRASSPPQNGGVSAREKSVSWNKWVRQIHRWLSIAFTVGFIVNFVAVALKSYTNFVGLLALLPLLLLLLTGLYLFILPYATKGGSTKGTGERASGRTVGS